VSQELNPTYVRAAQLRKVLGHRLAEVEQMAPKQADLQCILNAARLIENFLRLDLEIQVVAASNGRVSVLRRRCRNEPSHNMLVEDGLYVDYRMYQADSYEDRYSDFLTAVINFAAPYGRGPIAST
jgi:hypothetical protein